MATYNGINDWLDNMVENADLASDVFTVALSNTAPGAEGTPPTGDGAGVLANVTEIVYTNLSSRVITTTSSTQTAGTYSLVLEDLVLTASGAVATFQYIYIYDDTVAVPVKPLVCYYDYGSALTLANGETLTIDFNATGLFQIS